MVYIILTLPDQNITEYHISVFILVSSHMRIVLCIPGPVGLMYSMHGVDLVLSFYSHLGKMMITVVTLIIILLKVSYLVERDRESQRKQE